MAMVDPADYPITIQALHQYLGAPCAWAELRKATDAWFHEMLDVQPKYRPYMLEPGIWDHGRQREIYRFDEGRTIVHLEHSKQSLAVSAALLTGRQEFKRSIVARLKRGELEAIIKERGFGKQWISVPATEWCENDLVLGMSAVSENPRRVKVPRAFDCGFRDRVGTPLDQAYLAYGPTDDQAIIIEFARIGAPDYLHISPTASNASGRVKARILTGSAINGYADERADYAARVARARAAILSQLQAGKLVAIAPEGDVIVSDFWREVKSEEDPARWFLGALIRSRLPGDDGRMSGKRFGAPTAWPKLKKHFEAHMLPQLKKRLEAGEAFPPYTVIARELLAWKLDQGIDGKPNDPDTIAELISKHMKENHGELVARTKR